MKKYIVEKLDEMIADKNSEWAQNYVAKHYQQFKLDSINKEDKSEINEKAILECEKQIKAADFNMDSIGKAIKWLKEFKKSQKE